MKKIYTFFVLFFGTITLYGQTISLVEVASGFNEITEIANNNQDNRLFVVEQAGIIKIVNGDGTVNPTPFLNISSIVNSSGNEQGLLGLAFHPDYQTNGYFFVNYTNSSGTTVIARYSVSTENPDVANPSSASVLLTIPQPFSNHNGGSIKFGPDGYLWISVGDGGSGGDPNNNSQNKNTLLGKMLRISVDGDFVPYSIPSDNPFADGVEGEAEIWSYGLRNAWKFSFDRLTNDLWIADVGQNAIEEINKVSPTEAGLNFGWRCYEGNSAYNTSGCPNSSTMTFPVAQYSRSAGRCSITGGYVYRGSEWSDIYGLYFFADYCSNQIGVVNQDNSLSFLSSHSGNSFTTFGEDTQGNLYVGGRQSGKIFKINGSVASVDSFSNTFKVYPNPAKDTVNITSSDVNQNVSQVALYDLSGKMILNQKAENIETNTIDISQVSEGFYILKITDSGNKTFNYKLKIN